MDTKKNIKALWEYLNTEFDSEEIKEAIQEFEFEANQFDPTNLSKLSEDDARALLFDLAYMAVNELFGGDFHTWNEVLCYNLEFDKETLDFLDY